MYGNHEIFEIPIPYSAYQGCYKGDSVTERTHLMTAIAWITVGTTIGLLSPWLILRVRNRPAKKLPRVSTKTADVSQPVVTVKDQYGAVSLWPCLEACGAAWKMQGERFLSSEAPELPLASCDQKNCECRFREHSDRRVDDDRRDNWARFGGFAPRAEKDERRGGPARRKKLD